jgi:hypothetical protein
MDDGTGCWFPDPSTHDIAMLGQMYGHDDIGSGGSGDDSSDYPPESKSWKCSALSNGRWVTVHTFWVDDYQ